MNYKKLFIYQYLKNFYLKWTVSRDPKGEVNRVYYKHYKKACNLKEPKNLIEKIFWLELYSDTTLWTKCADKYQVREYVHECGLNNDYLPMLYGHWDRVEDIDFGALPDRFVIKANNGCGSVVIVKDKSKTDLRRLTKQMKHWLVIPYGWAHAQLHYTRIEPCIIAEELLSNDYADVSASSLVDFKLWCINAEPKFFWVAYNRHGARVNMQAYDTDWNSRPDMLQNTKNDTYKPNDPLFPKPDCLEEMLSIARRLAAPFPQVRVDFYIVNGRPVIGELTLSTGYGYFTDEVYEKMGEEIDLSKIKRIK